MTSLKKKISFISNYINTNKSKIEITSESTVTELIAWYRDQNWKLELDENELRGERQIVSYSPIELFKGRGPIPELTPLQARNTLWDFDTLKIWQMYDPDLAEWDVLGSVNEDVRIIWQVNKLGFPISNRELVLLQIRFDRDGLSGIAYKSLPDDEVFAPESSHVRSTAIVNGFIFEEDNSKTYATRIIQIDPNGQLPSKVVNYFATGCYKFSKDLGPVLLKIYKAFGNN